MMTQLEKLERAYDILLILVDAHDEECRYDHHGHCQTHWLHDRPCPIEQAKELINTKPTSFAIPNN
jgi:hypothetical protein